MNNLRQDLEDLGEQVKQKQKETEINEDNTWRIVSKNERMVEEKFDKGAVDEKTNALKRELQNEKDKQEDDDLSSGLESDGDLDLLVEQEVLQAMKLRRELKQKMLMFEEEKKVSEQPVQAKPKEEPKAKKQVTREQAWNAWVSVLKDVPTDYDFVIYSQSST